MLGSKVDWEERRLTLVSEASGFAFSPLQLGTWVALGARLAS